MATFPSPSYPMDALHMMMTISHFALPSNMDGASSKVLQANDVPVDFTSATRRVVIGLSRTICVRMQTD